MLVIQKQICHTDAGYPISPSRSYEGVRCRKLKLVYSPLSRLIS